jgi:DMSO/TMAO reductase YedYZ molybdopterin-dependent catalytic subunit
MEVEDFDRRTLLKGGGAAFAGLTVLSVAGPAHAFPGEPGEEEVLPWLDQPAESPFHPPPPQLVWEELDSWHTPNDEFFVVTHFNQPALNAADWRLAIRGLVAHPKTLTLNDLKARPRREVDFTLECSGNTGLPFFIGGVGNARWAGTPLAPLLKQAGVLEEGIEVVFWGADKNEAQIIRDNVGVLDPDPGPAPEHDPTPVGPHRTGSVFSDGGQSINGVDLKITEHFARSMTLDDALNPANLLCYEMNGEPLPAAHGYPVRLIAPGWYGVANVKWLTRIEVWDQQYRGNFMARDYVTIREQVRDDGEVVWTFANVRHDRLKSAPAKVTRRGDRYRIMGAAWGAPVERVEVRVDDGEWMRARLERRPSRGRQARKYAWRFWTLRWDDSTPGEHTITSRAFDVDGNVQPAPDDPYLAGKVTFWESNGQITRRVLIPSS